SPPEHISSHGLNVRALDSDKFRLYVVNHGGRESVEAIDIRIKGQHLMTSWRGCVHTPKDTFPYGGNGVVPLPDNGLALAGGGVATWHPDRGWKRIDGFDDGNGIEVSHDAQWLFVDRYNQLAVVRVPVEGGASQTVFKGDFHPDNLRWGEDDR